jgi:DNA-binding transcriptional regulator YhcF (GntR family)
MLSLTISRNDDQPLADQIVAGIMRQIQDRHLRPGAKLPSIRAFADTYKVSRFTVVEAYDRLVAMGYLQSRRGAGFFTSATLAPPDATRPTPSENFKRNAPFPALSGRFTRATNDSQFGGMQASRRPNQRWDGPRPARPCWSGTGHRHAPECPRG